jgi:hypothetical protein
LYTAASARLRCAVDAVGETLDLLSIGGTALYAAVKRGDLKRVKTLR